MALVGFGFSAYLTYLELFVIDAICQWCVASAVLMTLLLVVNARPGVRLRRGRAHPWAASAVGPVKAPKPRS